MMSYEIFILSDDFRIPREHFESCLEDIYAFHRKIVPQIVCPGGVASFVAKKTEEKLCQALVFFNWYPNVYPDGLYGLHESNRKAGSKELLEVIAKYVDSGSEISFINDVGIATKYVFVDGALECYVGKIRFERVGM